MGKGNNSGLVRGLIKRRIWFAITDKIEEANFVWTQLKSLPYFKLQEASCNSSGKEVESDHYGPSFIARQDEREMIRYI